MVARGGHAWLFPGGHVWLLWGVRVFFWGGVCGFSQGGMHGFFQGGMHRIRRDTANERAVRILLECILVYKSCAYDKPMEYR